jgi:hypothetical protein
MKVYFTEKLNFLKFALHPSQKKVLTTNQKPKPLMERPSGSSCKNLQKIILEIM